jgi:hypothetical protein
VTKDAGPASCAIVASQWAGGAVREGEVLFSVFFYILLLVLQAAAPIGAPESSRLPAAGVPYSRWLAIFFRSGRLYVCTYYYASPDPILDLEQHVSRLCTYGLSAYWAKR